MRVHAFINLALIHCLLTYQWRLSLLAARLHDELRTTLTSKRRPEPLCPNPQTVPSRIERGRIADDEDLRMARDTAILLDTHASGLVSRRVQPFARRRRRDASRPDHGAARNAFVTDHDGCLVNRFDRLPGAHL